MRIIRRDSFGEGISLRRWLFAVVFFFLLTATAPAAIDLHSENPVQFFTNVASRLLKSELNVDFARIQIYPTNQYTPSVHRILQVTANLYDANTNNTETGYPYLPTAFRPIFSKEVIAGVSTNIYIVGYANVIGANEIILAGMRDLTDPKDLTALQSTNLVYGIPVIIGAKKGLPNFNEYTYENTIAVTRQLEFRHLHWDTGGDPGDVFSNPVAYTNQLYTLKVTNSFAVEAWNSYATNYPRNLRLIVTNDVTFILYASNELGQIILSSNRVATGMVTNYAAGTWTNFGGIIEVPAYVQALSFRVPLSNNIPLYSNNFAFVQSSVGFGTYPITVGIGANPFPTPQWWAKISSRLRYILTDTQLDPANARLVDYVELDVNEPAIDITSRLMSNLQDPPIHPNHELESTDGAQWVTNSVPGSPGFPVGILNQILAGTGDIPVAGLQWASAPAINDVARATATFRGNLLGSVGTNASVVLLNVFNAPYVPVRVIYNYRSLQADDPLVHYTLENLTDLSITNFLSMSPLHNPPLLNIGLVNRRYQPWGEGGHSYDFNPAMKDPLVKQSDDWNFPSDVLSDPTSIGRVHRGTPWQTIYLKSADIDTNAIDWELWTGDADRGDSLRMRPVTDWHLAGMVVSWVNPTDPRKLFSPNNPSRAAWLKVLDGIVVETNNIADDALGPFSLPSFDTIVMRSNSPEAGVIADAILQQLGTQASGAPFHLPADVLATSQLSLNSPWLNTNGDQLLFGISEDMYEAIPSQLLPLLRLDSICDVRADHHQIHIHFCGIEGCHYLIQTSSDLRCWKNLMTCLPTNGEFCYDEPMSPHTGARYYRCVLLP